MKIVTWNINSIRLRIVLLEQLVRAHNPDVILLQETKVSDDLFPYNALREIGYHHLYYQGQKSYNGVAILSKLAIDTSFSIKLYNDDKRHVAVKIGDLEIHNFYIPAGGDIPDINENPKFKHKLEYVQLIREWFKANRDQESKIILAGDLNIAPLEHDVWSSKQLSKVVSHTDIERAALINLQNSLGLIDSARYFTPAHENFYTWWSYRSIDWQKSNRGRRLDHIWVSKNLQNRLIAIEAVVDARNWQRPSDHVPYIVQITDETISV